MGENCEHGMAAVDCSACWDRAAAVHACVEAAYAQGRADERAAVVAWLRGRGYVSAAETSRQIDRGEHVDAGKENP